MHFKTLLLWNFEKEEAWINDMALEGWMLNKIRYVFYYFEKDTPGTWEYTLELPEKDPYAGSREGYLDFLKESGVEIAARSRYWIYLRSRRGEHVMGSEEHALQQLVRTLKAQKFTYKLRFLFTRLLVFSGGCLLCSHTGTSILSLICCVGFRRYQPCKYCIYDMHNRCGKRNGQKSEKGPQKPPCIRITSPA